MPYHPGQRARFQPTRPLRGATGPVLERPCPTEFQPTRPLRGATANPTLSHTCHPYFNPRAPCGARRLVGDETVGIMCISTHAPLAGRDVLGEAAPGLSYQFQPTRPLRGATMLLRSMPCDLSAYFNPRAPCGARLPDTGSLSWFAIFQPTRPLRGATYFEAVSRRKTLISTHAPLAGRDCKSVQITMHIFAITDKFQMLLHRMPPVRAFCSFLMQENHADFGCEPPK